MISTEKTASLSDTQNSKTLLTFSHLLFNKSTKRQRRDPSAD